MAIRLARNWSASIPERSGRVGGKRLALGGGVRYRLPDVVFFLHILQTCVVGYALAVMAGTIYNSVLERGRTLGFSED